MTTNSINFDKLESEGGLGTVNDDEPDDVYLVCASYEPRSVAGAKSLSDDYRARKGIIYVNEEFTQGLDGQLTRQNLSELKDELRFHCDEVVVTRGSWLKADVQLNALKEQLTAPSMDELTITIDTTTFNREALLVALNLLQIRFKSVAARILYVSPKEHGEWLSRGKRFIRNIIGFAGINHANKPTVLIILSGFEKERTMNIVENFEPTKVLLGISNPSTEEKFRKRAEKQQKLILARQETQIFEFPADDIHECHETLNEMIEAHIPDWNVVVAPMSTKLSTVGAWMAALKHPEVQVAYCLPSEYNTMSYSKGMKDVYIDQIEIE